MANDKWCTTTVGQIAHLIREAVDPADCPGSPYVGLEHIGEGSLTLLNYGRAKDVQSAKLAFRHGDILFGKLRPYFRKVVLAPFDGICSTDIWVIRSANGIDQRFLFYVLASKWFVEAATLAAEGTRMPRANWGFVSRLKITVPPLSDQRAIAHILGTLDDKIELNRRINETLEAIARAIFKSWFVDFDPVIDNALKAGKPIPDGLAEKAVRRRKVLARAKAEGHPAGLPDHLARLFPDEFEESELGWIPKGWKVGQLAEILRKVVSGSRPKGGVVETGVPSIGAENVLGLGKYDYSKEKYIPREFFEKLKRKGAVVRDGDVLLYKDGTQLGRKTYFAGGFPCSECAVNEHVFILRCHEPWMQRFLFFWLDQDWMTCEIIALNSNSAQPGINKKGV